MFGGGCGKKMCVQPVTRSNISSEGMQTPGGVRHHPQAAMSLVGHQQSRAFGAYSITSSARSIIDGGTARPSAVAVLRFTTISNLVGNYTGRSPGFAPRRMRST
jgi:hypothetical protein